MKNIDKIKQMNTEELAQWLMDDCSTYCSNPDSCVCNCIENVKQ